MAVAEIYAIEHKCGHTSDRDLSDTPAGKRAGLVNWWRGKSCTNCFSKTKKPDSAKIEAEREARRLEIEADQERSGLPLLQGSEKQVSWAMAVRYGLLSYAYSETVEAGTMSDTEFETELLEPARLIDAAKWWIDNREAEAEELHELFTTAGSDATAVLNENPI